VGIDLTFDYDSKNRLTSAQNGTNTMTVAYDYQNRQVSRTINGTTVYFIYDGWSLLEERDVTGNLVQKYVHGAQIDEILWKQNTTGEVYYHHDGLGSTIALTDETGAVVESYSYDAFGSVSIYDASNSALSASPRENRFLFTGREWIGEIGIYDYRNRIYSPELGRFLQTDPIRFDAGDVNFYRYVANNSIRWIDPNGLEKRDCFHTVLAGHGSPDRPNRPAPDGCGDAYGQVSCYGDRWNDEMVGIGRGIPGLPRNNRGELLELDGTPFGNNANRHLSRAWKAAIAHAKSTCRDKSSCCRSVTVTLECDAEMEALSRNPITIMSAPGGSLCGQRKTIQCGN
jgi:RHS repeat-associated protein